MAGREEQIVCRRCGEEFPTADENCPHCGTPVRGYRGPFALIVLGVILVGASIPSFSSMIPYILIGLALAVIGGYVIYDKRSRINEATRND